MGGEGDDEEESHVQGKGKEQRGRRNHSLAISPLAVADVARFWPIIRGSCHAKSECPMSRPRPLIAPSRSYLIHRLPTESSIDSDNLIRSAMHAKPSIARNTGARSLKPCAGIATCPSKPRPVPS